MVVIALAIGRGNLRPLSRAHLSKIGKRERSVFVAGNLVASNLFAGKLDT
jgi:hypothetical protein